MKIIVICCFINLTLSKVYGTEQWSMNGKYKHLRSCPFYKDIIGHPSFCYDVHKESRMTGPVKIVEMNNFYLQTVLLVSKWISIHNEKEFKAKKKELLTFTKNYGSGNCQIDKASAKVLLDKLDYHLVKRLSKEFILCIAESKWMFCHIIFRACVYDKSTKSFRYLPPCQETCDFYIRETKSCREFVSEFFGWYQMEDSCLFHDMFFLNCSFYPKKLAGICQDIPLSFSQKSNEEEMKVSKHNINTKWIYIGTSLTIFCIAVAVAIGIVRLGRKNSKDKEDYIQPYEKLRSSVDYIQLYEQPQLSSDNVISEVHESGLLSTSF